MKTVVSLLWPISWDAHAETAALSAAVMSNITMQEPKMMPRFLGKKKKEKKKTAPVEPNYANEANLLRSSLKP